MIPGTTHILQAMARPTPPRKAHLQPSRLILVEGVTGMAKSKSWTQYRIFFPSLTLDAAITNPNSHLMDTLRPHQQHTFRATKPTPRRLEPQQAPVHNSAVAATEAVDHSEAPVPAAEAVVADSRVGIGVRVATAPGLLPVSPTTQVRAVEHHKLQMPARHRRFTARHLPKTQRILSGRLKSCK